MTRLNATSLNKVILEKPYNQRKGLLKLVIDRHYFPKPAD
jgi:hypothetical protein